MTPSRRRVLGRRAPCLPLVAVAALAPACTCGNPRAGGDVAIPTHPSPPPPTLPPPGSPNHLEVPPAAATSLSALRADLARGAPGIAPHLALRVELRAPTQLTGPDADRVVAYLGRFPDVLVALAASIDRGCAANESDTEDGPVLVTCPAEALDDEYSGVALELAEQPDHYWRVVRIAGNR